MLSNVLWDNLNLIPGFGCLLSMILYIISRGPQPLGPNPLPNFRNQAAKVVAKRMCMHTPFVQMAACMFAIHTNRILQSSPFTPPCQSTKPECLGNSSLYYTASVVLNMLYQGVYIYTPITKSIIWFSWTIVMETFW